MTASSSVRPSTAVADPNNPTNVLVPAMTRAQVVVPSTSTNYSPVLLALVAATTGNVNVRLENSTVDVVLRATAGVPITGIRVVQVRTTSTNVTGIKGLT
jgi:hypothetical protein